MSELGWPPILSRIVAGESLGSDQTAWAMGEILGGATSPAVIAAFIAALRTKGETVDELLGLVTTMRRLGQKVEVEGTLVDTCGTGGDRSGSINASTIAAIIVAGAGAKVAKHGNRAMSSACGSADLFEELGVKIELSPSGVQRCIEEARIGFCFAPVFHPAMRHAAPIRKEIGVVTTFNFLGPLTNPAGATRQALGVSDPRMAPKMLEVLRRLGSEHVIAFSGSDGLDEITTTGPTHIWELNAGKVVERDVSPDDFGLATSLPGFIKGGTPTENAKVALDVLAGAGGPVRDLVLLNASAALVAAGVASDFMQGAELAAESIDSSKAQRALDSLIEVSNRFE